MNKLVPLSKFSEKAGKLTKAAVLVDEKGTPLGFTFGRDSFISFLQFFDDEFEKRVENPKKAYNNPAGRLIDLIEEKLPVKSKFISDIKEAKKEAKKTGWVNFEEIEQSLNV